MASPDHRPLKRPRTAQSHFWDTPPSSPAPTCPLPLPPISPSPISSVSSRNRQISPLDLRSRRFNSPNFAVSPSNEPSHLQSPFTSPSKPSIRGDCPHIRTARTETHSLSEKKEDGVVRPGREQTRWSQPVTNPSSLGNIRSEGVLGGPAARIPPKIKRKSRKPPQKAVARSPMHIPSADVHVATTQSPTTLPAPSHLSMAPLLQYEPITSLPPWPTASQSSIVPIYSTRRHHHHSYSRKESEKERAKPHGSAHVNHESNCHTKSCSLAAADTVTPPATGIAARPTTATGVAAVASVPEQRISFCAVTNLEELYTMKENTNVHASSGMRMNPCATDHVVASIDASGARQSWHRRYRKLLWALATVFVVLSATAGILTGVFWKLQAINRSD